MRIKVEELCYPCIIVWRHKHDNSYYIANSSDDFYSSCRKIFNDRKSQGYFEDVTFSDNITDKDIFRVLAQRSAQGYEYEGIEVVLPE